MHKRLINAKILRRQSYLIDKKLFKSICLRVCSYLIILLIKLLLFQIQKQDFSPKENGSDISKDLSASSNTINTINTAISGTLSSSAASPFHGSSVKSNVDVDDLDVKVSLNRKDHITNHSTGNGVRQIRVL